MKSRDPKKALTYFLVEKKLIILVTFFGIIFNVSQVFGPIMLGRIISKLERKDAYNEIVKAIILYFIVILLIQVLRFLKRYLVRLFAAKTSVRIRSLMYKNTINLSIRELSTYSIGDLMNRCISDVDLTVEGFRKALTEVFDTGVLMIAYFLTLLIYDYKITLLSSMFIPIAMIIAFLLKKIIYHYGVIYRKKASQINSETLSLINNAMLYRNYNSYDKELKTYSSSLDDYAKKAYKANLLENAMPPVYKAVASIGVLIIFILGAKNVSNSYKSFNIVWDIGVFSAYISLFMAFAVKASKASKLINTVQKASVSFDRIKPYLEEAKDDNKSSNSFDNSGLVVTDLSFKYDNNYIFNNLSFTAKKGEIIGVTGKVASGKSTLGISLLGLYEYEGSVKLDGVELSSLTKEERAALISYSGHNPYLFSDSIRHNISFGNDNIDDVLANVDFDYDLNSMDNGCDTLIGDKGIKLSGGQRQRISLARALYKKNELIILDDPFSASDVKTEEKIISNLRKNYSNSIIIIISHRLKIFKDVDKVIMLDDKALVMPHNEMMEKSSLYNRIYNLQRGEDND